MSQKMKKYFEFAKKQRSTDKINDIVGNMNYMNEILILDTI